jgi:hypothetical protein
MNTKLVESLVQIIQSLSELVLVQFPFTDLTQTKLRPALVLIGKCSL